MKVHVPRSFIERVVIEATEGSTLISIVVACLLDDTRLSIVENRGYTQVIGNEEIFGGVRTSPSMIGSRVWFDTTERRKN